jgi:hypothetical protein
METTQQLIREFESQREVSFERRNPSRLYRFGGVVVAVAGIYGALKFGGAVGRDISQYREAKSDAAVAASTYNNLSQTYSDDYRGVGDHRPHTLTPEDRSQLVGEVYEAFYRQEDMAEARDIAGGAVENDLTGLGISVVAAVAGGALAVRRPEEF